jgi:hypothetical protein
VTVAARPSPLVRAASARWPLGAEIALFLVLMAAYEWVRDLVAPGDPADALRHAGQVIDAQRALGLFVEPDVQRITNDMPGGEFTMSWLYTLGHTPGFIVAFCIVWFTRRRWFAFFRNWFWATNAVALLGYALYPLAPPRLAGLGLADPTDETLELGGALSWFQPFRNEYAAMPSMHVGYTVLFALALFWLLRPSPRRWLVWLWPAGMLLVVMATANHYWLDGVGGAVAVLAGLGLVHALSPPRMLRPWQRP